MRAYTFGNNHAGFAPDSQDSDPASQAQFGNTSFVYPQNLSLNVVQQSGSLPLSTLQYLEFSNAAYYDEGGTPGSVNGWHVVASQTQNSDGMQAVVFQNTADSAIVISFEGTNWGNLGANSALTFEQLSTDSDIGTGTPPAANADALNYANGILAQYKGEAAYLTGHSLGGEEAEYVEATDTSMFAGGMTFAAPNVPDQSNLELVQFTDYQLAGDVIAGYSSPNSGLIGHAQTIGNTTDTTLEKILAVSGLFTGGIGLAGAAVIALHDHLLKSYAAALGVNLPTENKINAVDQGGADIAALGSINGTSFSGTASAPTFANGTLTINGDTLSLATNTSRLGIYNGQASELVTGEGLSVNPLHDVSSVLSTGDNDTISGGTAPRLLLLDTGNTATSFTGGSGADTLIGDGYGDSLVAGTGSLTAEVDFGSNNSTLIASAGVAVADYSNSYVTDFLLEESPQSLAAEHSKAVQMNTFAYSASTLGNSFADTIIGIPTVVGSSFGSTLTVEALPASFWTAIPISPIVNLGVSSANNEVVLNDINTSSYFSITSAANSRNLLAYANSDGTSLPNGQGVTVANPGNVVVVLDGALNSNTDTVVISGDLSKTLSTFNTIQIQSSFITYTLDCSGLTSATDISLIGNTGHANDISMGLAETLIIGSPVGTISGFSTGNVIDITGDQGFSSAEYATLGPNNVLNVIGIAGSSNGPFTLDLSPSANYSGDQFVVSSDGDGGTDISVVAAAEVVITAPESLFIYADAPTPVADVRLADGASDGDYVLVSDVQGTLSAIASASGSVMGSGSNSVTLSGPVSAINEELASLTYVGASSDTIAIIEKNATGLSKQKTIAVKLVNPVSGGRGTIYWKYPYSASWDEGYWITGHYQGTTWIPGSPPGPNDNASISVAATVTIGNDSVNNLSVGNGAVVADNGTLSLGGRLIVDGGKFDLDGEISGGTIQLNGGEFDSTKGTLSGVTFLGSLSGNGLEIKNGLTLKGATGAGVGTLNISGNFAILDSETLNNAVVNLAGGEIAGNGSSILGRGLQINLLSAGDGPAFGALSGVTNYANIVAYGQLDCGGPGAGTFTNYGTITLEDSKASQFSNTTNAGTIIVTRGSYMFVDQSVTSNDFRNSGSIILSGGVLSVGGTMTSLDPFQDVINNGGVVEISSTIDNNGTITLAPGLGDVVFNDASVSGGVINNLDPLSNFSSLLLENTTLNGTTTLNGPAGTSLEVAGYLSGKNSSGGPDGTLKLAGNSIYGDSGITLNNIVIEGFGTISVGNASQTLTIGSGAVVSVDGSSGHALILGSGEESIGNLTNAGTLEVSNDNYLIVGESEVKGLGQVYLSHGGIIAYECGSVSGQTVTFTDDTNSVLNIGQQITDYQPVGPTQFSGTVKGFGGSNVIALNDYNEPTTKLSFTENTSGTAGVLSISDGTYSSRLTFMGQYVTANFVILSYDNYAAIGFATGEPNGTGTSQGAFMRSDNMHYPLAEQAIKGLDAGRPNYNSMRFVGSPEVSQQYTRHASALLGRFAVEPLYDREAVPHPTFSDTPFAHEVTVDLLASNVQSTVPTDASTIEVRGEHFAAYLMSGQNDYIQAWHGHAISPL